MTALVFMDTETTGLSLDDDIWEFAAIRREEDGSETEHHMFLVHDEAKCRRLPESFLRDHNARYDCRIAFTQAAAAEVMWDVTRDAHVVGAVPNFDTERMALLLRRFGFAPTWHYHLGDAENFAVGYLAAMARWVYSTGDHAEAARLRELITPPWKSDDLSRACGVDPPTDERHTAVGDAKWARALYDAITGGTR